MIFKSVRGSLQSACRTNRFFCASSASSEGGTGTLNILRFRREDVSVLNMLELEEKLLRTRINENYLIINSCDGKTSKRPSIVMGLSGKAELLLNTAAVIKDDIEVLRRYTGGGTVIVDNSTVFIALIMNSSHTQCPPYPREIMDWTDQHIYRPTFEELLKEKEKENQENNSNLNSNSNQSTWSFKLRENDYIFQDQQNQNNDVRFDKKIGGNAQTITKDRFVSGII